MKIEKTPSGVYVARVDTLEGRKTVKLGGVTTIDDAKRVAKETNLAEIELIARTGKVRREILSQIVISQKLRCADALRNWIDWMNLRLAHRSVRNAALVVARFLADLKIETEYVHLVTDKQVDRWINNARATDKASTRSRKLSALRTFFDYCCEPARGYAVINPAKEVPLRMDLLKHEQKEPKTTQPFTEGEYETLCAGYLVQRKKLETRLAEVQRYIDLAVSERRPTKALDTKAALLREKLERNRFWTVAVQIAWQTGLRFGDICQLSPANVREPGKLIVWTDKTNQRVELKIKPGLSATLRAFPGAGKDWLFPGFCSEYSDPRKSSGLSREFSRFVEGIGIQQRTFHSFRAAYATEADRKGMPLDHIRQRLGHSSTMMTSKYIH